MTFSCLILCSNLGNCLNHRKLIPVMPLPPLSCMRPMHCTTGLDSPWIPAKPNDFQVPRPLLVSVCIRSRNGPVFCLHTLLGCQIVTDSVLFNFQIIRQCQNTRIFLQCSKYIVVWNFHQAQDEFQHNVKQKKIERIYRNYNQITLAVQCFSSPALYGWVVGAAV